MRGTPGMESIGDTAHEEESIRLRYTLDGEEGIGGDYQKWAKAMS